MTRPARKTDTPPTPAVPPRPWRPLPRPDAEQGSPARGIVAALALSGLFWAAVAAII